MPADGTVPDLLRKILSISQSKSKIPQGTQDDKIFRCFGCPPDADEEEGMWYVVNQALDSCFGIENCEENLRSGKYGIEVVLHYLEEARKDVSWKEDVLLAIKLQRIYKCFEDAGGVIATSSTSLLASSSAPKNKNGHPKPTSSTSNPNEFKKKFCPAKVTLNTSDAKSGRPKSKTSSSPIVNSSGPIKLKTPTLSNSKPIASKSNLSKTKINRKILLKCPKSNKEAVCDGCSIVKRDHGDSPQDLIFKCHCGGPRIILSKGRVQNAEIHWSSTSVSNTRPLTKYFSQRRSHDCNNTKSDRLAPTPPPKKKTIQILCSGLNDKTWPRDRVQAPKFSILQCIKGSPSTHHGAPPRHLVCQELFGTTKESELTQEEFQELLQTLELKSRWIIRRHEATAGIFSSKCERLVDVPPSTESKVVCSQCLLLKDDNSLIKAINREYATGDTVKYIPAVLMERDLFFAKLVHFEELQQLHSSLEPHSTAGDNSFWTTLAVHAKHGLFDQMHAFQGLVKSVATRAEREAAGKALNGMHFDSYFDSFLTTMAAMSPAAAKYFRDTFHGRSLRSMRHQRQKNGGQIDDGIVLTNFERVAGYIKALGYTGPLALASDQTVCVKSLRSHNGHLIGAQGGDVAFSTLEEISELVKKITTTDQLCSKVRLYTIQVPLPKVPSFVVALIASYDKETAEEIAASHISVLNFCSKVGMSIVSIGSDGAATEIAALRFLQNSVNQHLSFHKADAGISIQVPLMGNPQRPVVPVQDPKHACKTAANQILSGARLLSFGKFHLNISHLVALLGQSSPLYAGDVLNCDKQDDGRAYRTMNWETLEASLQSPQHTGLAIYLYLFGELTDAWLSPTMDHLDRIRSAWTCIFFMQFWHHSINDQSNPLMSIARNGISRQSYEIFHFLGKALIGLIISHREYYLTVPLLPWKHGTEACEHIFGWMRVIMPNFTVLDARQMLPKIFAIVKNVMGGQMKMPESDHLQSGYKYNFTNKLVADSYEHLAHFPSNLEITHELAVAKSQARKIAMFAGIDPSFFTTSPLSSPNATPNNDEDANEGISISTSADYEVVYACVPGETPLSDIMHDAAISMGEKQQVDSSYSHIDMDNEHELLSNQTRMSISNLLNPIPSKPPTLSTDFLATRSEDKYQLVIKSVDGSDYELNHDLMIDLRKKHDTQNRHHHSGNENRKQKNFLLAASNQSQFNLEPNGRLQPSECSKLVALILKENTSQQSSIARMHRWNIQVQFNLSEVRNTSTHVDVNAQLLVQGGTVSKTNELVYGKYAVIIEDMKMYIGKVLATYEHISGKHRWLANATSRAKLSYVSVQLYFLYQPHIPIAAGFFASTPTSCIFAHLEAVHLHHLFPISEGLNITDVEGNCVSIPRRLQPLLLSMSQAPFLAHWQEEFLRAKAHSKKKTS
ncbi:hypothetical protein MJO28_011685 [Puccinia striiformis f. sp. tritici]|uniref:Uncharacterized protein n=1 Tax=Puccinia striiformis f. sp. tritici TaxID=168172 RepID=A0ACC0E3F3_9BASI|nr:hypothetical protein MJO28_011685 [Puccinia striiformis f. sp. tritici]